MGPEGAINVIFRQELEAADDADSLRAELVSDYRRRFANPYVAASRGFLDAVIAPRDTRVRVVQALAMLRNKRPTRRAKKHGNIPL